MKICHIYVTCNVAILMLARFYFEFWMKSVPQNRKKWCCIENTTILQHNTLKSTIIKQQVHFFLNLYPNNKSHNKRFCIEQRVSAIEYFLNCKSRTTKWKYYIGYPLNRKSYTWKSVKGQLQKFSWACIVNGNRGEKSLCSLFHMMHSAFSDRHFRNLMICVFMCKFYDIL